MGKIGGRTRGVRAALLSAILLLGGLLYLLGNQTDFSRALAEHPADHRKAQGAFPGQPYKVMIDPGHGGKDPGAKGIGGKEEKDSNLAIAAKVYELLKEDPMFDPRLTRSDDTFVPLEDRAGMANDWKADVFLSIHGNSYEDSSVGGTETYYLSEDSIPLARAIQQSVVESTGFPDRGMRLNHLKVLDVSRMPAVLVEPGYLTNAAEGVLMQDENGQSQLAQAIVDGLKDYFSGP